MFLVYDQIGHAQVALGIVPSFPWHCLFAYLLGGHMVVVRRVWSHKGTYA